MTSLLWYGVAAIGEISGCFAFWAWLRLGKSPLWLVPGVFALLVFAMALTRVDTSQAGRAFAAYGGVYIVSSLGWMWIVEGVSPDPWDAFGALLCLLGAAVILFARKLPV